MNESINQRGSALLICLVFLLLLTLIGVSSIQDSTLQERMAGNERDRNTAFQAAELALRDAEVYLQGAALGTFNGTNGLYAYCMDVSSCSVPAWSTRTSTGWVTRAGTLNGVSSQPQYIIQKKSLAYLPADSLVSDKAGQTLEMYEITARGFGSSDGTMVVVRSSYRRS